MQQELSRVLPEELQATTIVFIAQGRVAVPPTDAPRISGGGAASPVSSNALVYFGECSFDLYVFVLSAYVFMFFINIIFRNLISHFLYVVLFAFVFLIFIVFIVFELPYIEARRAHYAGPKKGAWLVGTCK